MTKEPLKPVEPLKPLKPKPKLGLGSPNNKSTDAEKRAFIESAEGAITFRRGKLKKGDVWNTAWYPYGPDNQITVVGLPPKGARVATGPQSAYKTVQKLYGKKLPNKTIFFEGGAVDAFISPSGGNMKISFRPDIGIKPRMLHLSSGGGRITPRMPKLR